MANPITTVSFPRAFEPEKRGTHWYLDADGQEVKLSNLTKVLFPGAGYTKGDVLAYYYNVADTILPYLKDRPLTLWRMPDGVGVEGFFEKQAPAHTPDWVPRAYIEGHSNTRGIDFLLAQDLASLLYVANLGCIEMHPLHATQQATRGRPDYAFFDLDPMPPISFSDVKAVARMVMVALENLGLKGYPKIGATGIVVYVPLDGTHTYEEARAFVERVCRIINKTSPDNTTMEWEVSKRGGKVFLDHGMVREAANIAGAYSLRATPDAIVSIPMTAADLDADIDPADNTIATVWPRFEQLGDLFEPMKTAGTPQGYNLTDAMVALGIDMEQFRAIANAPVAPVEPLRDYKRKRKFDVTSEPEGALGALDAEQPTYMIHKHNARRLHYDLRLERAGVLVSFAIPKGLPEVPNERRLAVHVEDHPIEYATFEGHIPDGEYGGGEVRIFDQGTYEPLEWFDNKITIRIHGERIQGEYHIVQTKQGGSDRNWLIFRSARDVPLHPPAKAPPYQPMLATNSDNNEPFDKPDWMFEPKWDGVRTLAWVDGDTVALRSRGSKANPGGRDVTHLYPELASLVDRTSARNALIDGEIIALDKEGRPSFEAIQQRFTLSKATQEAVNNFPVTFMAFDLIWLDGESLVNRTMEERRHLLDRSLMPGKSVQLSPQIPESGKAFFAVAKQKGLEGIIGKKVGSLYKPGERTKDWIKFKTVRDLDVVIVGWAQGKAGRTGSIGSLVVAVYRDGTLTYAGHVGTGFTGRMLDLLTAKLTPLQTDEPAVDIPATGDIDLKAITWVRPELVCSVEYLEFTSAGRMRAASFRGLRDDKDPTTCTLD